MIILAEKIELSGSKDRGDGKFEKAEKTTTQTNYYVGDKESGKHCHMWKEHDTGRSGVEHRGQCNVCEDEKSSGGK